MDTPVIQRVFLAVAMVVAVLSISGGMWYLLGDGPADVSGDAMRIGVGAVLAVSGVLLLAGMVRLNRSRSRGSDGGGVCGPTGRLFLVDWRGAGAVSTAGGRRDLEISQTPASARGRANARRRGYSGWPRFSLSQSRPRLRTSMSIGNGVTTGRSGAIAGLVSVLLMASGVAFVASLDLPYDAPAALLVSEIEEKRNSLGAGIFLFALAGAFLFWFLGALHSVLREAEGGTGSLSSVALAAGSLWAFLWVLYAAMVFSAFELMGYYNDPQAAKTAGGIGWNILVGPIAFLLPAVLLLSTAVLSIRAQALPRWLGWASAALAGLLVLGSGLGATFGGPAQAAVVAFPLWVLVTSVVLLRARPS